MLREGNGPQGSETVAVVRLATVLPSTTSACGRHPSRMARSPSCRPTAAGRACLVNASVVTLASAQPRAEAVAVAGSRILAVGSEAEVRAAAGPQAAVLDCGKGTVLPGFIDAHIHLLALARSLSSVDLSPARVGSIDELGAALRRRRDATPARTWIRGHGYDEFHLRERRHPTRRDLDRAVSDRPVRVRHRTRHASVLNSVALAFVADRLPELLHAEGVERESASQEPTGVFYDLDAALASVLPRCGAGEVRRDLARASTLLAAAGVTAVDDASPSTGADEMRLIRAAAADGLVHQRVRPLWGVERHGLPTDATITGVKFMLRDDGRASSDFQRALVAAHERGLQVAVHAVEGPAIAVALAAFEVALAQAPRAHRHRIEHCALCPPPLADRIARLGLGVVAQPAFLRYMGDRYAAEVPRDEQGWLYPLRTLAARGIPVAGSSDAPVGPLAPVVGIAGAVGRRTASGQILVPDQALPLEDALGLYTTGAAYMTLADDTAGRIVPDRPADLVCLDADVTRVPVEELDAIGVRWVVIDGRVVDPADGAPEAMSLTRHATSQTRP